MSEAAAPVWVLLGQRTGDNNQLLRLAGELGVPFRTIELQYNRLHVVAPKLLGPSLTTVTPGSRQQIAQPWPKLVLGIGYRSVPVALAIRDLSGGLAKLVRLGKPRLGASNFDLVITTPQYDVPDAPNVLRLPLGISTAAKVKANREEEGWLGELPRPHRLLLIGGDSFMWTLPPKRVADSAKSLSGRSGSIIAVNSGRSSKAVMDAVSSALRNSEHGLVRGRFPRYPVLLEDADEVYATADSVAMVSDAIATGKPVGLIEPRMNAAGRLFYALERFAGRVPVRDLRRFWASVRHGGLAGTIEQPLAANQPPDALGQAVAAVRKVLAS